MSNININTNTEKVLAGEVCSIDIAKKYGFFDNENYFKPEYSDTITYSGIDTPDRKAKICKQSSDGAVAYPSCTRVYGVPYQQDKIEPSKCVIDTCPPNFKKDGDKCTKPSNTDQTAIPIAKKTHCDEKSSDWYMIPNYHLGNKYNFISDGSNVSCMKPCDYDKVPGYTTDPVDDTDAGPLTNTLLSRCYTKDEYMAGKYNNTNNFCPISWVYRLGQTKEQIYEELISEIKKLETKNGSNPYLDKAKKIASSEAERIYTDSKKLLENIKKPSGNMISACRTLLTQNKERQKKAYDICQNIHKNPKAIEVLLKDPNQQQILRQACNTLFCNPEDDIISTISPGTEALCFSNTGSVDSKAIIENDRRLEEQNNTSLKSDSPPKIENPKNIETGIKTTKWAFYTGLFILIGIPILAVVIYAIYRISKWTWKRIIKPYLFCGIKAFLTFCSLEGWNETKATFTNCQTEINTQNLNSD